MMIGNREMQTTCGIDDTQLMLARDAGDELAGSAIAPPGRRRDGRVAGRVPGRTGVAERVQGE